MVASFQESYATVEVTRPVRVNLDGEDGNQVVVDLAYPRRAIEFELRSLPPVAIVVGQQLLAIIEMISGSSRQVSRRGCVLNRVVHRDRVLQYPFGFWIYAQSAFDQMNRFGVLAVV